MKWINENHLESEISDSEFQQKVEEEARTRDLKKYGRDGYFIVYEEKFIYKAIPYFIKVLRYYQIGVPLDEVRGCNHLGKHAVLEFTPEVKELSNFLDIIQNLTGLYEFLWADTLHSGQENWTLKQMVNEMQRQAKEDIDKLPTVRKILRQKFREYDKKLSELLNKVNVE